MTPIENELVESSGFKPARKYQRQDYLAALARAVNEIDETDFDGLSVEAQDWFNEAVRALNKKQDLPEFPDGNGVDTEEAEEEEAPPPKKRKAKAKAAPPKPEPQPEPDEDDDEADEPDEDDEPDEAAAEDEEATADEEEAEAEDPPAKPKKALPARRPKGQPPRKLPHPEIIDLSTITDPRDLEIVFDKWGHTKGTKAAAACAMFEKGARMADVTATIGGTYYNILSALARKGHRIEKESNGLIRVIHKDEKPAKSKKK